MLDYLEPSTPKEFWKGTIQTHFVLSERQINTLTYVENHPRIKVGVMDRGHHNKELNNKCI